MAHAHEDAIGHSSADAEYLETPPGAGHEHTDASVWIIVKFMLWLAVSAVVIHIGLGLLYAMLIKRAETMSEQERVSPLVTSQERALPPAPRLQQKPRNELYDFRRNEDQFLQSYGWVDKNAGTVHIPISEAMKLLLQRTPQSRPAGSTNDQTQTLGLMPSDASSGRVMERRRQ